MRFHSWSTKGLVYILAIGLATMVATGLQASTDMAQRSTSMRTGMQTPPADAAGRLSYIVQFNAPAAVLYTRNPVIRAVYPALASARYLDVRSPVVQNYVGLLRTRHSRFLENAEKTLGRVLIPRFEYRYALNGMAVRLTPSEAARLRTLPDVNSVQLDRSFRLMPRGPLMTAVAGNGVSSRMATPDISHRSGPYTVPIPALAGNTIPGNSWIGADKVWALPTFDTGSGSDNEGEGVIIADIDTGINALNSSFAASGADGYTIADPLGANTYLGVCNPANITPGQPNTYQADFPCNSKLIGAYTYTLSTGNDPYSPEDSQGHGSWTASLAVGDFIQPTATGITYNQSGMAPHANVIAYDVCDPTTCSESTIVAAVDQAIQDLSILQAADTAGIRGMVISVTGGITYSDPYTDPESQAFEAAEQAGIFVSIAAGNAGPTNPINEQIVLGFGPWNMTVGASTDDGSYSSNDLENFSGGTNPPTGPMTGQGATGPYGPAQIVYAGNSAYTYSAQYYAWLQANYATLNYSVDGAMYQQPSGNPQTDAAQCFYPFIVPAGQTFTTPQFPSGAIVVCDRGTAPLMVKAANAQQGGAGGVVIATNASSSQVMIPPQFYDVPGVLLGSMDGSALENWINSNPGVSLQAQIGGATYSSGDTADADYVAAFSSRGPVLAPFGSLIKPDVAAPGENSLGADADPCYTVTPPSCMPTSVNHQPETFFSDAGTSASTPTDGGAGALLMQSHPGWDPMAIKSALMTTAVPAELLHDQCDAANAQANGCTVVEPEPPTPQAAGAGRIDVAAAARAGFVLEVTKAGFDAGDPDTGGDLTTINLPSLGNANCISSCTWTRTLSSAQPVPLSYSVSSTESWLSVQPSSFTLQSGATQTLTFTAKMQGLTDQQWAFARVDFTTASLEMDSEPAPTQHFPVAAFDATSTSAPPSSSGGGGSGGGGFGLLSLLALLALGMTYTKWQFRGIIRTSL